MEFESMFKLSGKVVFILSPNKWGKMKLSKHHYAITLANLGNRVFFIEPPDLSLEKKMSIQSVTEYPGLFIVSYRPFLRGKRFLPAFIIKRLLKKQVAILKKAIQYKPDLVMSFDPCRFENLKWFGATYSIYFAADLYPPGSVPGEVTSADICFGVSPTIVEQLKKNNSFSYFIHHGLNTDFELLAQKRLEDQSPRASNKTVTVGYIGNLLMGALDRFMMKQVISARPELKFVFWGQYEKKQDHLVAHKKKDVKDFIDFLETSRNVELRGPKHQTDLANEIEPVDMFWMCYDLRKSWLWDGSNSHKILEYLATGKPVVSHHIATYKNSNLLYMMESNNNDSFAFLFDDVVEKVKNGEDESLKDKRIKFALSNSYEKHVMEIASKVDEVMSPERTANVKSS